MNQPVKIPRLLWLILILFLLISIVTTVIAIRNPSGRSYPRQITVGIAGPVGAQGLPGISIQGPQGIQGVQGVQGIQGTSGTSIQGPVGVTGLQGNTGPIGPQGPPGDPGTAARQIEIRHDDVKAQTEWRYEGDLTWQPLVQDCVLTNTCSP